MAADQFTTKTGTSTPKATHRSTEDGASGMRALGAYESTARQDDSPVGMAELEVADDCTTEDVNYGSVASLELDGSASALQALQRDCADHSTRKCRLGCAVLAAIFGAAALLQGQRTPSHVPTATGGLPRPISIATSPPTYPSLAPEPPPQRVRIHWPPLAPVPPKPSPPPPSPKLLLPPIPSSRLIARPPAPPESPPVPVLPVPPTPPTVVDRINSRYNHWVAGSNRLEDIGVIVHGIDHTEDPEMPWAVCPPDSSDCGFLSDRMSASVIWRTKGTAAFGGGGGVILNPNATRLLCIYGGDGGTRGKTCSIADELKHGVSPGWTPEHAPGCTPGCVASQYDEWCDGENAGSSWCDGKAWRMADVGHFLELDGGMTTYNEASKQTRDPRRAHGPAHDPRLLADGGPT